MTKLFFLLTGASNALFASKYCVNEVKAELRARRSQQQTIRVKSSSHNVTCEPCDLSCPLNYSKTNSIRNPSTTSELSSFGNSRSSRRRFQLSFASKKLSLDSYQETPIRFMAPEGRFKSLPEKQI